MLLGGPRLEGVCFPSDKNHLAPSEESAPQHVAEKRSTALAPPQCTQAAEDQAISRLRYLTARFIGFIPYFQREKGKHWK